MLHDLQHASPRKLWLRVVVVCNAHAQQQRSDALQMDVVIRLLTDLRHGKHVIRSDIQSFVWPSAVLLFLFFTKMLSVNTTKLNRRKGSDSNKNKINE